MDRYLSGSVPCIFLQLVPLMSLALALLELALGIRNDVALAFGVSRHIGGGGVEFCCDVMCVSLS